MGIGELEGGGRCARLIPATFASEALAGQAALDATRVAAAVGLCPAEAVVAVEPVLPSPEFVALSFVERMQLPAPDVNVDPGFAVTGRTAYLESRASLAERFEVDTVLGPLVVDAAALLWVDWGDGTGRQGPFEVAGAPWPEGTITHRYRDVGAMEVTAELVWTVDWSVAGQTGTLGQAGDIVTADTLPLEVRQIQAVLH